MRKNTLAMLLLLPSTWGALAWTLALLLYALRFNEWQPALFETYVVCIAQILLYMASARIHLPRITGISRHYANSRSYVSIYTIVVFHVIGFIGVFLYANTIGANFGGLSSLVTTYTVSPLQIRAAMSESTSFGTQISYFGWVAITATVLSLPVVNSKQKLFILALLVAQLAVNLLFIDRTRPVSFLFFGILALLLQNAYYISNIRIVRLLVFIFLGLSGIFISMGLVIGKIVSTSADPFGLVAMTYYLTAGIPYLDHVIAIERISEFTLENTFAPFGRVLVFLGLMKTAVPNILSFYWVPIPTNVGTLLTPFYRDGGWPFLIVGMFVISFVFDSVAVIALKSKNIVGLHFWAFLCLSNALGFFASKHTTLAFWMFAFAAIALGRFLPLKILPPILRTRARKPSPHRSRHQALSQHSKDY